MGQFGLNLLLLKLKTETENTVVGPIFNEKVVEKWNLWVHEQCTDALFMEDLVKCCG